MRSGNLAEHLETISEERRLRDKLRLQPRDAATNFALAKLLAENDRGAEALPFAEDACRLAPRNFQYLYYCGALYQDFRQLEYAVGMLRASVEIEPRVYLSQFCLADCYYSLGKGDKALVHFRAALKLARSDAELVRCRVNLANCLSNSGENEQAILLYEKCIDDTSEHKVYALCQLAKLRKSKPGDELEKKLLGMLNAAQLADAHKEEILLTLGAIHDTAKNFDQAFDYWRQSRAVALKIVSEARSSIFRNHVELWRKRVEFYTPQLVADVANLGHMSEAPVFVAGMPRSGTTLTEQILGSHPQVAGVGEIARWYPIEEAFYKDYPGAASHGRLLENAVKGELKVRAEEHLLMMKTIAGGERSRYVEKTTHSFIWLGYLATCFSKARFLHLIRHPADTFISTYQNQFNRYFTFAYDQVEFAKEYAFSIRMMNLWKSLYPGRIETFYYETLVDETESEARRMVSFLGLQWDDRCLRFHERVSTVRTFSSQQVRQPIFRSSLEKWRAYEKHLTPLLEELERQGVTYHPGQVTVGSYM